MPLESGAGAANISPQQPDPVARQRETRSRAAEAVARHGATNAEVLAEVAQRASAYPPDENLLQFSLAAARYTLTNLESARLIAEQIRAEIELGREESRDAAAGAPSASRVAALVA